MKTNDIERHDLKRRKLEHDDSDFDYDDYDQYNTMIKKTAKNNNIAPGNYSEAECASSQIQSHNGPITSLSFTPDGEYIVSTRPADGIKLWHLHQNNDSNNNIGSILMPTCYIGPNNSLKHPLRNTQRIVPMLITQPGSNHSGAVWLVGAGNRPNDVLGYDIHGTGGRPNKVLSGHIDSVTAIASQEESMRIFTGGADGMVLAWGC